tara:strand:- start:404 stop:829 length:426 start_codon:yes stop_codon:yes gene_type:complete
MIRDQYHISRDRSKLDIPLVHDYLSKKSYWAKGRSIELVRKSIENSICFGVFDRHGTQIGFARLVTDEVVFEWLMDIFIIQEYRGKGIGRMLLHHVMDIPELREVNGIGLRTNDAHGLYRKFGFELITNPDTWMLRKKESA